MFLFLVFSISPLQWQNIVARFHQIRHTKTYGPDLSHGYVTRGLPLTFFKDENTSFSANWFHSAFLNILSFHFRVEMF